jgi:predicted component of type VI protein secretion system
MVIVKLSAYLKGIFKQKITKNKRKKLPESLLPRWIKRLVPLNVEPRVNTYNHTHPCQQNP